MSKQILQMKYHPAKKEVEFHRFQSGKEIQIPKDSKLRNYMNKRGSFILQDHGNTFLSDIAGTFDGERIVNVEVVTTKNDFEDFMQMTEFYNETNPNIRIDATLLSELPDMEQTYHIVKNHGEMSIGVLERHKTKFFEVPMNNSEVKKCVENFALDIQKEINSIKEKIEATSENNVNLCFAGVYSTGKSALINAILGYAILPEASESKTARMCRIQSPKDGENVRIVFQICAVHTELIWNEKAGSFEFTAGPAERDTRKAIQTAINNNTSNPQHMQINEILNILNSNNDVSSEIHIYFPIPLDSDKVQFTIYDTPGTDSNHGEHQMVLKDALSEQTHSILIFTAAPGKLEGEGNNALLNYLQEAEQKDSKTSIDIGRSLFVINKSDTNTADDRKELQTQKITCKDDARFSIKLSDKKLFFASAKVAYAAKAKKNGVQTKNDEFVIRQQSGTINDEELGRYYQQNRCATSEYATNKLIEASTAELENAEKAGNILDVLHICSGVYALENEITLYGEKFAAAVKAFAIIDSVDKALSKMNTNAQSLERQNQQDITKIDQEIENLRSAIADSIKEASDRLAVPDNAPLPAEVLSELHLDSSYLNINVIGKPKTFIEKLLKGWFIGLGKVRFNEKHKREISQKITSTLDDFTRNFLEKRQKLLERQRNSFMDDVKRTIQNNGNISDEAKNFVLAICPPDVKKPTKLTEFGEIYDSYKRADKFLLWDVDNVDKKQFIDDAEDKLSDISTSLASDFERDYRRSLQSILKAVEMEFIQNLDKYSVLMKAKLADRKAMEQLREKILGAAADLEGCQKELEKLIWSVKSNG